MPENLHLFLPKTHTQLYACACICVYHKVKTQLRVKQGKPKGQFFFYHIICLIISCIFNFGGCVVRVKVCGPTHVERCINFWLIINNLQPFGIRAGYNWI